MKFIDIFRYRRAVVGEVGIEVEVEGKNLPPAPVGWTAHPDHSLRGEEQIEYVLRQPCVRQRTSEYLNRLGEAYKIFNTTVDESNRTSVHVHINMQEQNITKVFNYITMFIMLEPMLVHFCGEEREGNLFCLRSSDAEWFFTCLEELVTGQRDWNMDWRTDHVRYSAINLASLKKFGSLEFRSMRGTSDMQLIEQWINILLRLKDVAVTYDTPIQIIESLSGGSLEEFVVNALGEDADIVFTYPDWEETIMTQTRNIQMMAYTGDWRRWNFIDEPEEDC